ncbi:MAG: hypothetical protein AAGI11_09370 [Pseudomonadota bacterium]
MARDDYFEWGPLAKGCYIAMASVTVLVAFAFPHHLYWYLPLVIFLGVGLKTVLVRTGLAKHLSFWLEQTEEARWSKITRRRRLEIERQERDKRYRHRHKQDPRLPKNW